MSNYNNNLPWVLLNLSMTLNNNQMKQKMTEIIKTVGMSIIEESKKQNSFQATKKTTNVIKNICSVMLNKREDNSVIQITFQFLENQYDRLVEIRAIKGNNYINESLISSIIKKSVKFSKSAQAGFCRRRRKGSCGGGSGNG